MHSTPTIPYATAPARSGVSVEQDAHHVSVIVPPIGSWRMLGGWYLITVAMASVLAALEVESLLRQSSIRATEIGLRLIWPLVVALLVAAGVIKLHLWRVFTVTASRFEIATRIGSWRGQTTSWPIRQVAQVTHESDSDHIMVRIIGQGWLEFAVSPDRRVTAFVAGTLDGALHAGLLPAATGEE